jgi:heme exporter protein C
MRASDRLILILLGLSALMFTAAPYVIDTAPNESTMGLVYKIFYFHFPSAMTMMLSALICGGASATYLFTRRPGADRLAVASAELTVLFGALVLVTGPLWARKSWGVWWEWDARITSTFVMWMVFNAYLLLRRFGGPGSEIMAAAVGFFGMALVPFIYWSVNFWRTQHPSNTVIPTLPVDMGIPLYFCWIAFTVLYAALILIRLKLERVRSGIEHAYLSLED